MLIALELQLYIPQTPLCFGTGFPLRYGERTWLITCQHNLETELLQLTGRVECTEITIRRPFERRLTMAGRTVVGARVNGIVADCAAVEFWPDELPAYITVQRPTDSIPEQPDPVKISLPLTVQLGGENRAFPDLLIRYLTISGYTNGLTGAGDSRNFLAGEFTSLPVPKPFMMAFHPGTPKGISGGPVIELKPGGKAKLIAVNTHTFQTELNLMFPNGSGATALADCGGAVPIDLLLRAMDGAIPGRSQLVDVAWPLARA